MKKSTLLYTVIFIFFLAISNFSQVAAQTATLGNQSALLYEVSGNGLTTPSYLFGTIHIICPKDMIPMAKLNQYIDRSDRVILELDLDDPTELQKFAQLSQIPGGKSLTEFLTNEQIAKIDELTKEILGIPFDNLKNSHPIVLQSMLITSQKAIGCKPPGSYELSFIQAAAARKKPIEGLETIEEQMEALNKTPFKDQAESIYKMAEKTEEYFAQFRTLVETYKTQDAAAIFDLMQTQINSQYANDPNFQSNLLDGRNENWIPKIEKAIAEKPSFIAFGSGHLGGKNGVLKLLRKKGYKLKPIRF